MSQFYKLNELKEAKQLIFNLRDIFFHRTNETFAL